MSNIAFSDSIEGNLDLIRELLTGLPAGTRNQAKLAAVTIEKAFRAIQRDAQGNPGAALGTAFAIYTIAQEMVQKSDASGQQNPIIELLN